MTAKHSYDPVPAEFGRGQLQHTDHACLIFTSGTTGLPKAAPLTHKSMMKTYNQKIGLKMAPGDVQYNALPMYHTFATMVGVSVAIENTTNLTFSTI